jgi:molybdate transport system ATP-binding protein
VILSVDLKLTVGSFDLAVNFELPGGITALFGPSGSGKTLTLRSIAGLTNPRAGRIELGGRVLFDASAGVTVPARDRSIGYVFQQYALFPHLTVAQNLAFGIHALPQEERKERVGSLLQLLGLEGFGTRRPRELSGGQQQRVALGRALATEPSLLLLDEPFAAVDFRVRRLLRSELRRIHDLTGTPMVLVTHDLGEVRQLSDTLVLMDQGQCVMSAPTAASVEDPMHPLLSELSDEQL